MPQIINTNIASLTAQRNLNSSQSALNTSLQRLSSGLRINSAKDDAAGLAISERFTTQIRGLNQASRNANDAISLSQTAEGALGEIGANLQRIRELAVQSANATNSASDRAALDLEVQQRIAEVDRIASQTSFNGQKILDGTFGTAQFQVGANVGETISLDLSTSMKEGDIGSIVRVTSSENLTGIIDGVGGTYTVDSTNIQTDYSPGASEMNLGNVTDSVGAAAGSVYTLSFTAGSESLDVVVTGVEVDDASLATAFGVAGFNADGSVTDGSDDVNGFTLDLGAAATIEAALTANSLSVVRTDGVDFDYVDALTGTAYGTSDPSIADITTTSASTSAAGTGATAGVDNSITFSVAAPGGSAVEFNINTNITSADDFVAAMVADTDYATAGFTVAADGDNVVFTDDDISTGSFAFTGTDEATVTDELITDGDVAGVAGTSVVVSADFSIQLGEGTAVSVADGTYTTAQSFVDAVNTALAGNATAELNDDGTMSIYADENVTITGATGLTTLGFDALSSVDTDGLSNLEVSTVSNSNDAIRRIDSALGSVSDLRSTFGAIQNRFESTISNLSTAVESLSAARSRIQDADFASETAALTRAQILQQAGVSILSQANSLPQSVLGLLQ